MSSILDQPVLMLNKSWQAVDVCTVASAFGRLFTGAARFLVPGDYTPYDVGAWLDLPVKDGEPCISTSKLRIKVPEVLILKSTVQPRRRAMQFSRRNVLRRDKFTCQYCGERPVPKNLTIDHIIPKRQGGKSTWGNCVASCFRCNVGKADRRPEEAGIVLRAREELRTAFPHDKAKWNTPYEPAWSPIFKCTSPKPSWIDFLDKH